MEHRAPIGMDWSHERVELAVLGTLVTTKGLMLPVTRLLREDDFTEPWRAEMLVWLREHVRPKSQAVEALAAGPVPTWARKRPEHLSYLFEAAGPEEHLPEYVRLLLEKSAAQAVSGLGVVLFAGALSTSVDQDVEVLRSACGIVRRGVAEHRARLRLLKVPKELEQRTDQELLGWNGFGPARLSAERAIRNAPRANPEWVAECERRYVAALVHLPAQAHYWTTAIGPDSISSRPWRAVYSAVGQLALAGRPLDLVTVAAEVQRASLVRGEGPSSQELREWVNNGAADDPRYWARQVAAHRLRRAGRTAALSFRKASENPGVVIDDLLDTAEMLTSAIWEAAQLVQRPSSGVRRLPEMPPGASPAAGVG